MNRQTTCSGHLIATSRKATLLTKRVLGNNVYFSVELFYDVKTLAASAVDPSQDLYLTHQSPAEESI